MNFPWVVGLALGPYKDPLKLDHPNTDLLNP